MNVFFNLYRDIDFDLCAPQIIIPENFFDKEATIMVSNTFCYTRDSETHIKNI